MQSTKGQTTVTRTGDKFTYQAPYMRESSTAGLSHIINAADLLIKQKDKTEAALTCLANLIESHTRHLTGEIDQYGLSALCACISDASSWSLNDHKDEIYIIEQLAEQGRKG